MRRNIRMLHASVYTLCVLRVGGRIGRLCGSEKAGRGCAILVLALTAVLLALLTLFELVLVARSVYAGLHGVKGEARDRSEPQLDSWGRDVRWDIHFTVPSAAYADLAREEQATQAKLYAALEKKKAAADAANRQKYSTRIRDGARDPNAFRMNTELSGDLPRVTDAVIDGIAVTRPAGAPPLPQLQTLWRTYTPLELYERYDDLDYIYTFVNGTEHNYYYRKKVRGMCGAAITAVEEHYFTDRATEEATTTAAAVTAEDGGGAGGVPPAAQGNRPSTRTAQPLPLDQLASTCKFYRSMTALTNKELLEQFRGAANAKALDERDRETDELRHSIRSLEQHVQWHRGRVVIVSPGHHPTWVDGARNFLAGTCGGAAVQALRARGTHLRLTTVHQDAVMPYGLRFTADSHTIEQHIWRVKNATPVHVYMNDDYFVNRDVAITDLFNEYGGTIVRTEGGVVPKGKKAGLSSSWAEGVAHVELFNSYHLEQQQEDYVPRSLATHWNTVLRAGEAAHPWRQLLARVRAKAERLAGGRELSVDEVAAEGAIQNVLQFRELLLAANHSFYWEAALRPTVHPAVLPDELPQGRIPRYYATHAPFVYCTNMFRHFSVRFRDDFAPLQLRHRERMARDIFLPFLYNGYIMARPWEASAQFLPSLLQLRDAKAKAAADTRAYLEKMPDITAPFFPERLYNEFYTHLVKHMTNVSIYLDNDDGCAPATLYRNPAANVHYIRAQDDLAENRRKMNTATQMNALYFNINAGFSTAEAASQVREFLHEKFPIPIYLEREEADATATTTNAPMPDATTRLFNALMQLPVVAVVTYDEGVCPLVRSLSLAFANHHRGRVHVSVQRYSAGAPGTEEETLRAARERLRHGIISAVPAAACTYDAGVTTGVSGRGESIADLAKRVMGELDSGVELPSTCGAASGTAGLRVRGFVIDARTPNAPVASAVALREALAMPGQTLALEDFRAVHVGPGERDVVLVLARADADAKAVHWITGASESDLLLTYPVPVEAYEDMTASVRWVLP